MTYFDCMHGGVRVYSPVEACLWWSDEPQTTDQEQDVILQKKFNIRRHTSYRLVQTSAFCHSSPVSFCFFFYFVCVCVCVCCLNNNLKKDLFSFFSFPWNNEINAEASWLFCNCLPYFDLCKSSDRSWTSLFQSEFVYILCHNGFLFHTIRGGVMGGVREQVPHCGGFYLVTFIFLLEYNFTLIHAFIIPMSVLSGSLVMSVLSGSLVTEWLPMQLNGLTAPFQSRTQWVTASSATWGLMTRSWVRCWPRWWGRPARSGVPRVTEEPPRKVTIKGQGHQIRGTPGHRGATS